MGLWKGIKELFAPAAEDNSVLFFPAGASPDERDTLSVIKDLSRAVTNDPDSVDIYLALGNLYRSKGDIERAIQIREGLLARPELGNSMRARIYFEMGQDYRRAGMMDRALSFYSEAEVLGISPQRINAELAGIFADSRDFSKAAYYYSRICNKAAEAHFIVRQSREFSVAGNRSQAVKLIKKALKIYPEAPEAWQAIIGMSALDGNWNQAAKHLQESLARIPTGKLFLLFEGVLGIVPGGNAENITNRKYAHSQWADNTGSANKNITQSSPKSPRTLDFYQDMERAFLPVLEKYSTKLLPLYYAAELLIRSGKQEEACLYLAKALIIAPDFWSARLAMLEISLKQYAVAPVLSGQMEYFISQARHVKRFICSACGLRREHIFYCCPRCHSWHSAILRPEME